MERNTGCGNGLPFREKGRKYKPVVTSVKESVSSICILLADRQFLRGDVSGLTTGAPEPLLSGIGTFAGSDVKRSPVSSADDMREGDLRMAPKCST